MVRRFDGQTVRQLEWLEFSQESTKFVDSLREIILNNYFKALVVKSHHTENVTVMVAL